MNKCFHWAGRFLRFHLLLTILGLFGLTAVPAFAQVTDVPPPSDQPIRLQRGDGDVFVGQIERVTEATVAFRTEGRVITIERDYIYSLELLDGRIVDGEYRRPDPARSRLFLIPTARPVGPGLAYVADKQLMAPIVAAGIGQVLSLRGGVSVIPFTTQIMYVSPKVTLVRTEPISVAAGGFYGNSTADNDEYGYAGYGLATIGSLDAAVTVGGGYADGGFFEAQPFALVGGEWRVSNRIKLLTENYLFAGNDGSFFEGDIAFAASAGFRYIGDRSTLELGVMTTAELLRDGGTPVLPVVGFGYYLDR